MVLVALLAITLAAPVLAVGGGGFKDDETGRQLSAGGGGGGSPTEEGTSGCGGITMGDRSAPLSEGDFVAGGCGYHTDLTGGDGGRCVYNEFGTAECVGLAE